VTAVKTGERTAPDPSASVVLEVSDLGRRFAGVSAVEGVSLKVRAGSRMGIIGPNGAGKTTFFNMLSGELKPTSGTVSLLGKDVTKVRPSRRVAMGLGRTYQITRVLRGMTVQENLVIAMHGLQRSKLSMLRPWRRYRAAITAAEELAASFGLGDRLSTSTDELSHGELRELEVCLALALKPSVLLLDEPAAGLSPAERVDIQRLLQGLPEDLTLVMIEHDMDVLRGVVDELAVLHLGRLVAQGTVPEVQENELVKELYLGRKAATTSTGGPAEAESRGQAPSGTRNDEGAAE
jgi:branched-chain amino acid transport system ATP-binding protein